MNSLDTDFHRRLNKRLDEEVQTSIDTLASGQLDHLEYKRICGRLRAFQDAKTIADEIERSMQEGK